MAWEFKDVWLWEFEYTWLLLEVNDLKETRSLCFLDYDSVKLIIVSKIILYHHWNEFQSLHGNIEYYLRICVEMEETLNQITKYKYKN